MRFRMAVFGLGVLVATLAGCQTGPSWSEQYEAKAEAEYQAHRYRVLNLQIGQLDDFLALQNDIHDFGLRNRDELDVLLAERRRAWYLENAPSLSDAMRDCIRQGKVRLGMSYDEVHASWGWPQDVSRSVGPYGSHSQWVYRTEIGFSYETKYLYLDNGTLTSWQD